MAKKKSAKKSRAPRRAVKYECVKACPHSGNKKNCTWHNPVRCPWGKRQ